MPTSLGTLQVRLSADTTQFDKGMKSVESTSDSVGKAFKGIAVGAGIATAAMGVLGLKAVGMAASFNKAITSVAAKAGAKGELSQAFDSLREKALEVAGATEFTGIQVAEGMDAMARAGAKVPAVLGAIDAVAQLSTAAVIDLGSAANTVTNIMAGFGIKLVDAAEDGGASLQKLAEFNDALVVAANNANTTVLDLGAGLKKMGPVATALGMGLNDVATAIALAGEAGFVGAESGTALRMSMSRLLGDSKPVAAALKKLGLTMADVNPESNSLEQIFGKLTDAGLDAGTAFQLFGRHYSVMLGIMGQGKSEFTGLRKQLDESAGEAKRLQDVMTGTLVVQFKILQSIIQTIAIDFGTALEPAMRSVVSAAQSVGNAIQNADPRLISIAASLGLVTFAAGAATTALAAFGFMSTQVGAGLAGLRIAAVAASVAFGDLGTIAMWAGARMQRSFIGSGIARGLKLIRMGVIKLGFALGVLKFSGVTIAFAGLKSVALGVLAAIAKAILPVIVIAAGFVAIIASIAVLWRETKDDMVRGLKIWAEKWADWLRGAKKAMFELPGAVTDALKKVLGAFGELPGKISKALDGVTSAIGDMFGGAVESAAEFIVNTGRVILFGWELLLDQVGGLIEDVIGQSWRDAMTDALESVKTFAKFAMEAFSNVGKWAVSVGGAIGEAIGGALGTAVDFWAGEIAKIQLQFAKTGGSGGGRRRSFFDPNIPLPAGAGGAGGGAGGGGGGGTDTGFAFGGTTELEEFGPTGRFNDAIRASIKQTEEVADSLEEFDKAWARHIELTLDAWEETDQDIASAKNARAKAMEGATNSVISAAGEAGAMAGRIGQAFAQGGPIAGIVTIFAEILARSEGFQKVMAKSMDGLDNIAQAFDGLFSSLEAVTDLGNDLGQIITTPLKNMLDGLGSAIDALMETGFMQDLADALESFGTVQIGLFPLEAKKAQAAAEAERQRQEEALRSNADNAFGDMGNALEGMFNEGAIDIDAWYDSFDFTADSIDGLADAANAATDAMLNVPTGFKVALARFEAIDVGDGSTGEALGELGESAVTGSLGIMIENMMVQTDNPDEFVQRLADLGELHQFQENQTTVATTTPFGMPAQGGAGE